VPGSKANHTIKNCHWWKDCKTLKFTHNFRAHLNPEYSQFLEDVGNGRILEIPVPIASQVGTMESLVESVYGNNIADVPRTKNLILALTLEACDKVNTYCINQLEGT
jgi:hypothetical protein